MTDTSENISTAGSNSGCALQYDDLREWLAAVEASGDLKVVKGANWHTDIGQVVEVIQLGLKDLPLIGSADG